MKALHVDPSDLDGSAGQHGLAATAVAATAAKQEATSSAGYPATMASANALSAYIAGKAASHSEQLTMQGAKVGDGSVTYVITDVNASAEVQDSVTV